MHADMIFDYNSVFINILHTQNLHRISMYDVVHSMGP